MIRAVLGICLLALAACGNGVVQEEGEPPLYKYSRMKTAVATAQFHLDAFWAAEASGDAAYSDFALQVIIPSKRYTREHVWVENIAETDTGYRGVVSAHHEIDDGFKRGDAIEFTVADISDWRFKQAGKFRGSYTSRAMLELVPNAEIDNIRDLYHESPVP